MLQSFQESFKRNHCISKCFSKGFTVVSGSFKIFQWLAKRFQSRGGTYLKAFYGGFNNSEEVPGGTQGFGGIPMLSGGHIKAFQKGSGRCLRGPHTFE